MSPSDARTNLPAIASSFGIIAISVYLLVAGKDIFIPLVLGIFFAFLIVALSHAIALIPFGRRRLPAWACRIVSIVLFILALTALVQVIAGNIGAAVEAAPQYQARLEGLLANINDVLASTFNRHEPITLTSVVDQIDLRLLAGKFAAALQVVVGNTFEIAIYVVFVLLEHRTFDRKLNAMFPEPGRQQAVRATLYKISQQTESYVLIKTLISLLIGGITYLTLVIANVDFAAFLGLLAFLVNFIPYVGSVIGVVLPALLALLQFGSLPVFTAIIGVLVATHAIIGNVLEPRLMGHSLNLSPLLMIVALAAWGSIWGITGMLLSVPLMVIAMIVLAQFPRTRPLAVFMSENGEVS
jgi:AI-2 transport protein TqsA